MKSTRTIPAKTRAMVAAQMAAEVEIHPAERAGMAVHKAVETGVSNVADAATTAGQYVFGFFKGLVKGH